ncbi:autotransporter assembly complex family protein [Fontimonas sp. SYSU GA230001]|uniref:autotransporter assembly complex protein TamA n=1 Tax=Fontimonas sp. SYSU GA230001 TaxID=3142450 RepID=UPI0032B4B50C
MPRSPRAAPVWSVLAAGLWLQTAWADVDVRIDGLDATLRDNVELRLGIAAPRGRGELDQALVEALHREAPDDIRGALQPFGYYNPEIDGELKGKAPDWVARYRIKAGPVTRLDRVEVRLDGEGAELLAPVRESMLRRLRPGDVLLHANYETAKAQLAAAAYAAGFLDARYTRSELRVYADDNRAEIELDFDTGPRYRFGTLTIEQDIVDPDFLERYVRIRPGEYFDPQSLLDTQFALGDLGYFQTLEVLPQRDAAEGQAVPVLIRTTPRPRTQYSFGVGYGTDTGARVGAGVQIRRLNRSGHTAEVETRLSEVKNTARGLYRIPLGDRIGESVGLAGELATERFPDGGISRKWSGELSLSRIPGQWKRKLYIAYTHEESELGESVQTADLLTPGLSLNRAELDDPIYARKGWSIFVDTHGGVRNLLSNTSFLRTQAVLRGVLPLGEQSRVLGRFEYGANFLEDFAELPASQRFFAGGDQSVRGYRYQSLGPTDGDGKIIGGKFLETASLEVETRLWSNWGAALFYDVGGAGDDPTPQLFQGIGAGARYRAPVGSVQLDLAHPLDGDRRGLRVHIGVRVGL